MVETARSDGERIPAEDIQTILAFGRSMIEHPVELVEGARRCWKPCERGTTSYG